MSCTDNHCAKSYLCGRLDDVVTQNEGGESIAPYVKVFFGDPENPTVTVGNNSSPSWDNTAIIKNFQYGSSDGCGVKIEIIDVASGSFNFFIDKITKCISQASSEYKMGVEWGWIVQNCSAPMNSSESMRATGKIIKSDNIQFQLINIETTFAEGKIKYILTGADLMQSVFASRPQECFGTSENPMSLTQAIRKLAGDKEPRFEVEFIQINKDGQPQELEWEEGGKEGPKSIYKSDNQNKGDTIQKWIEPFVSKNRKGIIAFWDSNSKNPKMTIMEDPTSGCNDVSSADCFSAVIIGRYMVNSGKCSPVISFNPQINWISALPAILGAGGNSGSSVSGATKIIEKECDVQTNEAGSAKSAVMPEHAKFVYTETEAGFARYEYAMRKNSIATSLVFAQAAAITAELRIQGDPRREYTAPKFYLGRYISLAVINPFHLLGGTKDDPLCGEWLAQPMCNEVLSNKKWRLIGTDHSISEGSYVTTLKLALAVPGVELPAGQPLGGNDSLGYVPRNTC
jgi:hypothetical protein